MGDGRRAWARALFALAGRLPAEGGAGAPRRRFGEALSGLAGALASSSGFREGLEDPSIPREQRVGLIESALGEGAGQAERAAFSRFARLLVDKGRIGLLPSIASAYGELEDASTGLRRLTIEAAREPLAAQVDAMSAAWASAAEAFRAEARSG